MESYELQKNVPSHQRESNFELLRIVAMMMIVLAHCVSHGVMKVTSAAPYVYWVSGTAMNRFISAFLIGGGDTGVGIFFLLSGYFMCISKQRRSVKKILIAVYFYAFINAVLTFVVKSNDFSILQILSQTFLPISGSTWWFVTAYIFLILFIPLINDGIEKLRPNRLLVVVSILWCFWFVLGKATGVGYYDILRAVWFYLVGAYLRINQFHMKNWLLTMIFVLSWGLYAIMTFTIAEIYGADASIPLIFADMCKLARSVLFGPLAAISLFLIFKNLRVKPNNNINYIASCVFGVYLLHDSPTGRILIWDNLFDVYGHYSSKLFPLFVIIVCSLVFCLGIFVEHTRKKVIEKPIVYFLDRVILKLKKSEEYMTNMKNNSSSSHAE